MRGIFFRCFVAELYFCHFLFRNDDQSLHVTFIVVPTGEDVIGSPDDEPEGDHGETIHSVQLSRAVAFCETELTWRQYKLYDQGKTRQAWQQQFGHELGPTDPLFGVNRYDAVTYCRWLSERAGASESSPCYDDPSGLTQDDEGNP